jgi:aerobic carbon-monoxide dehydrogenase small subunit
LIELRGNKIMSKIHVSTKINNEDVEYLCDPHDTMLDVLRNQLDLTGSKEGCGSGDCGACSVILDGELVCSCLMLAAEAEGSKLETIEGMAEGKQLFNAVSALLEC